LKKQMKTKSQVLGGLMLLLSGALSTNATAQLPGELSGTVEHYDGASHSVYINGQRYLLTPAAEAELQKATPGVQGFVGLEIDYSATSLGEGDPLIDRLLLKN